MYHEATKRDEDHEVYFLTKELRVLRDSEKPLWLWRARQPGPRRSPRRTHRRHHREPHLPRDRRRVPQPRARRHRQHV